MPGTRKVWMGRSPHLAAALFIPAGLGLVGQLALPYPLAHRILALALLLISVEQAHMAKVDLRHIALVQQKQPDARLQPFARLVWLTIVGQLVGFYLAATGYLGGGVLMILTSLLGFNGGAAIRLDPSALEPITASSWRDRLDVLTIDVLAMILGGLWMAGWGQLWVSGGLLALVMLYGTGKLITYGQAWAKARSAVHVADTAQQHHHPS
jgi:hypothetical protein